MLTFFWQSLHVNLQHTYPHTLTPFPKIEAPIFCRRKDFDGRLWTTSVRHPACGKSHVSWLWGWGLGSGSGLLSPGLRHQKPEGGFGSIGFGTYRFWNVCPHPGLLKPKKLHLADLNKVCKLYIFFFSFSPIYVWGVWGSRLTMVQGSRLGA